MPFSHQYWLFRLFIFLAHCVCFAPRPGTRSFVSVFCIFFIDLHMWFYLALYCLGYYSIPMHTESRYWDVSILCVVWYLTGLLQYFDVHWKKVLKWLHPLCCFLAYFVSYFELEILGLLWFDMKFSMSVKQHWSSDRSCHFGSQGHFTLVWLLIKCPLGKKFIRVSHKWFLIHLRVKEGGGSSGDDLEAQSLEK